MKNQQISAIFCAFACVDAADCHVFSCLIRHARMIRPSQNLRRQPSRPGGHRRGRLPPAPGDRRALIFSNASYSSLCSGVKASSSASSARPPPRQLRERSPSHSTAATAMDLMAGTLHTASPRSPPGCSLGFQPGHVLSAVSEGPCQARSSRPQPPERIPAPPPEQALVRAVIRPPPAPLPSAVDLQDLAWLMSTFSFFPRSPARAVSGEDLLGGGVEVHSTLRKVPQGQGIVSFEEE